MAYSTPRDLALHPRKKRLRGDKPNRSRRRRLNPGRRSRADRKAARPAEAYRKIGDALAGMVC